MIVIFFTLLTFVLSRAQNAPTVETPLGAVIGSFKTTKIGTKFAAFEGIPFAKPPIGDLRFQAPEPVEPWKGVWNATYKTICAQTAFIFPNQTFHDEDCLHINVYVPDEAHENLDVIVHIHGGAYMYGYGHMYAHPDLFIDRNTIFVSFNYRLGILGFLSTEDETVPGNNGLKDQVEALKWVQKNIASFGGNPNSVTLTGLSAGGSSVHYHLLSPLSKNLFHRAFSQSGSALNPWTLQKKPLRNAKKLGAALGCPTDDSKILVKCLKERPVGQLLEQLDSFFGYKFLPCAPFGPVVEKVGKGAFIKENPLVVIKKGQINDVPWLSSMTSHEGLFPVGKLLADLETIDKNWDTLAPSLLDFNDTLPLDSHQDAAQKIREKYFGDGKISQETIEKLIEVHSDRYFGTDIETAVRSQSKVAKSPVYLYVFGYPGDNNPTKWVSHGGDAKYFFLPVSFVADSAFMENELKMSDLLMKMIISFAKTGIPTIAGVDFKPTKSDPLTYLSINGFEADDIKLKITEELTPRSFWKSLNFAEGENLALIKDEL